MNSIIAFSVMQSRSFAGKQVNQTPKDVIEEPTDIVDYVFGNRTRLSQERLSDVDSMLAVLEGYDVTSIYGNAHARRTEERRRKNATEMLDQARSNIAAWTAETAVRAGGSDSFPLSVDEAVRLEANLVYQTAQWTTTGTLTHQQYGAALKRAEDTKAAAKKIA